jgi:hypothetical protein
MALQPPQQVGVDAEGDEHRPAEGKIKDIVHRTPQIKGAAIYPSLR